MRLTSPHFRPALLQKLARHTLIGCQTTPALACSYRPALRRLLCAQSLPSLDTDMGKEDKSSKGFNLKVPKGTRDCAHFHCHTIRHLPADFGQGPAKMPLCATACSRR